MAGKVNLFRRHGIGEQERPFCNRKNICGNQESHPTSTPQIHGWEQQHLQKETKKRSGPHGLLLLKKLKLTTINLQINLFTLTLKQTIFLSLMVCHFL